MEIKKILEELRNQDDEILINFLKEVMVIVEERKGKLAIEQEALKKRLEKIKID